MDEDDEEITELQPCQSCWLLELLVALGIELVADQICCQTTGVVVETVDAWGVFEVLVEVALDDELVTADQFCCQTTGLADDVVETVLAAGVFEVLDTDNHG